MPAADPNVELVFAKVSNVRNKGNRIVVHVLAGQEPTNVGPEATVARRMRIAFLIRVLVMHALRRNPKKRAHFQSERALRTGERISSQNVRLQSTLAGGA
jgi:hypothetical protein